MGWISRWGSLWMAHPFVLAPNFVSVTPSMDILFSVLGRTEVSTHWSSFFLIFLCFANCILGILSFWANIHLSMSAYQVTMGTGGKFLNRAAMACAVRSRIDKWDLIKLQSFCKAKDTVNKTESNQQIGKRFLSILNLIGD